MIDHFGINCADLESAKAFYDAVLTPLGFSRQMDFGVAVGYGADNLVAHVLEHCSQPHADEGLIIGDQYA